MNEFDPEAMEEALTAMIEGLSKMSDEELRSMLEEAKDGLMMLLESGMLPDVLAKRILKLISN